jgi:AsmA family/AsmA-like C-terminal region
VQTTLLGVAIAVILALVAALVAPLVVDWSRYRSAFEDEASRLTGLTVRVNGPIDARILPSPHFTLRDVSVGAAGRDPQIRAGSVELELGLGPLVRGEVRGTEMRLLAPQISLRIDDAGGLDWPMPSTSPGADALAVSRLTVEDGRVVFSDTASGSQLALEKLSFKGDIRSLLGPFNGEGAFVAGGEAFSFRISGGRAGDDGSLKLRLGVDPADRPLTTEIEGLLGFERGVPKFDGTFSAARPVGVTLAGGKRVMSDPWHLIGKVQATPAAVKLEELALQYGPEERAVVFTGNADLKLGAHPRLDGDVSARQVDLDRTLAAPDVTHRPPLIMFKSFLEDFTASVRPPMPLAVGAAVEAVTVGGAAIQALHGRVRFDADRGWQLDDVAFRAPGFTMVNVSGRLGGSTQGILFGGPASIESADLKTLAAWLEGRTEQSSGRVQTLTAHGDIVIARDRFVLNHLSASLDREKVEGRLAYSFAAANRPAALDGDLHAARLDVDAITAFAQAAASDGGFEIPRAVSLTLDVGEATLAGIDARALNARVKFNAGILHIDRLSIGDLGGAAIEASGRIDELSSQPRGQVTVDVHAATLDGLAAIAGRYAPQVPAAVRPFSDRLAPAKMHGALTIERAGKMGSVARLALGGTVGAMRLTLNGEATGAPAQPDTALLRVSGRLDADDGGALVRLFALDRVLAVDQLPGQMTLTANGPLNGEIRVNALASAGGFSAAADGAMHLRAESAPTGSVQLKATAADLRPLQRTLTGQAAGSALAPVSLSAIVGIAGSDMSVTDLTVSAGKASLRGRLDLKVAEPLLIAGEISGDDLDAATAAGLLLGLPSTPAAAKSWSAAPVGDGTFGLARGSVNFKFGRAVLTPALVARDFKGIARFAPPEIELTDLDGKFAGGRLSGGFTFRHDPQSFAGHGHVEIVDASAAAIAGSTMIDGVLSAKLQGESQGLSPEGIVGAFHGGGTISLARAQFTGLSPAAFDAAMRVADQSGGTLDAGKIRAAVSAAMDNRKLAVPKADAEVTIAGGQMRIANAMLPAQDGAQLALDGALDLNAAAIDAQLTLSVEPAAAALIRTRPELAVILKGPLAAPERKLDISALLGWLSLRAAEQQTRRLESLEANRRADVLGDMARPVPPAMRFIPQGTALEINNHANAAAAPPIGTNLFDRLRSEALPAPTVAPLTLAPPPTGKPANPAAASVPDKPADKTNTATGPVRPAPVPGIRSLLNSLFGSQN